MRLASLGEFRRLIYTPDSAPSLNTLRARIRNGRLAGGVIDGGHYYVDLDEFDRKHNLRGQISAAQATLEADSRLAGLI